MKNVLDYNIEDLNNLSIEELELLYILAEDGENEFNTRQLCEKTLMNALYGALANAFFPLFNEDMAAGITGNGRYFIRKLANNIENKLQSMISSKTPYILYSDTDSDYFHIEPFVNLYLQKNPESTIDETVTWCDEFEKKVIQPVISQTVSDFCDELNAYNREKIGADREIIADCLTGSNVIKVKIDGKNITMPIGTLAKNNSLTNKNELKRILNIQRKVTTKKILTLQAPNGRKIHVTEDHLIAIRENDVIIYKEAKHITEDDDVALFDHMMYTRNNAELYEIEYINHGSQHCDLIQKGKSISKSLNEVYKIKLEKNKNNLYEKIYKLYKKYKDKLLKILFRYFDNIRSAGGKSIPKAYKYLENNNFLNNLDKRLIKSLLMCEAKYRKYKIKKYTMIKKYGKNYFKRIGSNKRRAGIKIMFNRTKVIQRKYARQTKSTPLHTAKHLYRIEVGRHTKNSLKNDYLKGKEMSDKYNYNIDHIVPVMYGFHNKIPPELIGHINNLQVITKLDNLKKRCNIDYANMNKQLFKDYICVE